MCIEERGWAKAQILLTKYQYNEKFWLEGIIY